MSESDEIMSTEGSNTDSSIPKPSKSRKPMAKRATIWKHYTQCALDDSGVNKASSNYCLKLISCNSHGHGTSGLLNHNRVCKTKPISVPTNQAELNFQPDPNGKEGEGKLITWRFDQEKIRKAMNFMLVVDELPFKHVEKEGFRHFMDVACPQFRIPSRITAARDCFQLYVDLRAKLKQDLRKSCTRVCLTTDTWTSAQQVNYMCLTAHFIDNDWKLNKRIINFCLISSHKGELIGRAVDSCLLEWGIDKVMTVTVDNASSNDLAIKYLKDKFNNWKTNILGGNFLHMRCIAHIINLVVSDGLREISSSVLHVRLAVRYVKGSPSRLKRFKECAEAERIQSKSLLCLDVPTRWNSTYLMLSAALKFKLAFDRLLVDDGSYEAELDAQFMEEKKKEKKKKKRGVESNLLIDEEVGGVPLSDDWKNVERMVSFLEHFYELTLRVSGTLYVTANTYFHEISEVEFLLKSWQNSDDYDLKVMAIRMKEKYDKYWGNIEKMNLFIYVAVVLDPRHKLKYVEFALSNLYEGEQGIEMGKKVKNVMYELFNEYKTIISPGSGSKSSQANDRQAREMAPRHKVRKLMKEMYKKHKSEVGCGDNKSELDKYLSEATEDYKDEFDILLWWKVNSPRFPILSEIARNVLAIPISTVASESAFSTGGRVLDSFRSSLTPKIVQALICAQDWLRSSPIPISVEEDLADLEKLESSNLFA